MKKFTVVALVLSLLFISETHGQKSKSSSGSSRSSKPSSGSSRSSSGSSKSKFSSPSTSKPSSGSKPSSSSGSSKPKFSAPSASSSGSGSKPSSTPKFGSPSTNPSASSGNTATSQKPKNNIANTSEKARAAHAEESKNAFTNKSSPPPSPSTSSPSKYSSPSTTPFGDSSNTASSKKPSSGSLSSKAQAAKQSQSKVVYQRSQQATAPPKSSYTSPSGKTIQVDANNDVVKRIRSKPSTYISPEQREQRIHVHVQHHYSRPYSYYYQQPYVNVGNGMSSAFFWMMMTDWSAQRRAEWLYHHRDELDSDAYQRGVQDAQVAQLIADMKAKNVQPNPAYIDPEFQDDPSLMYDQQYLEAAYNPVALQQPVNGNGWGRTILWGTLAVVIILAAIFLLFVPRWGK